MTGEWLRYLTEEHENQTKLDAPEWLADAWVREANSFQPSAFSPGTEGQGTGSASGTSKFDDTLALVYSERHFAVKVRREDLCAEAPVDECAERVAEHVLQELKLMGLADMLEFCDRAGLTTEQSFAVNRWFHGDTFAEIARARGVSESSATRFVLKAGASIIRQSQKDPYFGWYLTLMENVSGWKLW